ncbi:MAG: hypothetical protein QM699_10775 [Amaricoccus sp.]|uniref:hypothetical protein n=1 Tax=Amaricoccus sp. TaxID=1872485 RepID=UPI0039E5E02F
MLYTRLGLTASLVAAAAAAAVLVTPGPAIAKVAFSRADLNRDGVVTFDEAERAMPRLKHVQYLKADANGDGVIDKGEYPLLDTFYGYVVDN